MSETKSKEDKIQSDIEAIQRKVREKNCTLPLPAIFEEITYDGYTYPGEIPCKWAFLYLDCGDKGRIDITEEVCEINNGYQLYRLDMDEYTNEAYEKCMHEAEEKSGLTIFSGEWTKECKTSSQKETEYKAEIEARVQAAKAAERAEALSGLISPEEDSPNDTFSL